MWQGRSRAAGEVERAGSVELVDLGGGDVEFAHAGPAGLGRQLSAVLLRLQADRCRLDPQRQVLADQDDALAPSAARLRATDKILVSLSPSLNPAGSTDGSVWFSSTLMVPPSR